MKTLVKIIGFGSLVFGILNLVNGGDVLSNGVFVVIGFSLVIV